MPWGRFPGAEVILGPEMKSTGEVMGIARSYPEAYANAAGNRLSAADAQGRPRIHLGVRP